MKLLPHIILYIKDAAKAVKRIKLENFKKVTDEAFTELLGIATLVVRMYPIRREGEHEVLHLWCSHHSDIALCTRCGCLSTTIHLILANFSPTVLIYKHLQPFLQYNN